MPTSTYATYAEQSATYGWDILNAVFFDGGALTYLVVVLIITGVIAVGIRGFKPILS